MLIGHLISSDRVFLGIVGVKHELGEVSMEKLPINLVRGWIADESCKINRGLRREPPTIDLHLPASDLRTSSCRRTSHCLRTSHTRRTSDLRASHTRRTSHLRTSHCLRTSNLESSRTATPQPVHKAA